MSDHDPIIDEEWIVGPFGEIWAEKDVIFKDDKWRNTCSEPRIIASTATLLTVSEQESIRLLIAASPNFRHACEALLRGDVKKAKLLAARAFEKMLK